jgi:hypothetical protein
MSRPQVAGPQQPSRPSPPSEHVHGPIIGLTPQELVQQLGTPALQIREGSSLKLQFRSHFCVLDAYLYPPPGAAAPLRVSYVDTRNRAMSDVEQGACVHSFEGP